MNEEIVGLPTAIVSSPESAAEALRLDERLQWLEQNHRTINPKTEWEIKEIQTRILARRTSLVCYSAFLVFMAIAYKRFLKRMEKVEKDGR